MSVCSNQFAILANSGNRLFVCHLIKMVTTNWNSFQTGNGSCLFFNSFFFNSRFVILFRGRGARRRAVRWWTGEPAGGGEWSRIPYTANHALNSTLIFLYLKSKKQTLLPIQNIVNLFNLWQKKNDDIKIVCGWPQIKENVKLWW